MPRSDQWLPAGLALGRYVERFEARSLGAIAREAALRCLLDALGCAAAARDQEGVVAARKAALDLHGRGAAPIWFTGERAASAGALFANSAAVSSLDLDDGHREARGHPGAAVIPAALACVGDAHAFPVEEFLAAIVLGYEVGLRMAIARPGYAPSGAWSAFAVVATAGRLTRASPEVIAHALAIAAQTSPALPALAGLAGSDVKEGIPAGCSAGWAALRLAAAGFSGPTTLLDDGALFHREAMLDGLGRTPLVEGVYFKPFGCCRHSHAALDALAGLRQAHAFAAEDIAVLEVRTYRATFNLANESAPRTLVAAQYSVPHCLAVAAVHGTAATVPLRSAHLGDPRVQALAQRVRLVQDPDIEALFPRRSPAIVTVELRDGRRFASPLTDPRGDPSRPMDATALAAKLRAASRATLEAGQQDAIIAAIDSLRRGDAAPLSACLAPSSLSSSNPLQEVTP